ncbi:MAG TPA: hypothetical protein DC060_19630 [Gemmatimonadetes bacterium]|nr:hypothetical protein [Gemmatimonadota bacterium]HBE00392.1 hypothetical protein [Gemmatimonadota bacterium]HIC53010.1 hypothetical protein [Gemmatimonadota bacterium]HIN51329.1 hypothetical protein [Gemmatimonadota bacterium]
MRKALYIAAVTVAVAPALLAGQSWRTVTMSHQIEDNSEIRVFVEYGAGHLKIGAADGGVLYRMNLRYDEDIFEPVSDFSGDRLHLGVESIGRGFNIGRNKQSGELDLEFARGIPMDMDLEFGAVRADIDFGGLALTDLDLSTGASQSTIDISEPNSVGMSTARFEIGAAEFEARHLGNLNAERIEVDAGVGQVTLWLNGRWQRDASVSIDMGLGALELRVPEGLGFRLRKEGFLVSLDSEGLVKRGDWYYSLDYEDADRKVTVDLDAAFGSVKVVWVR